MKAPNETTLEDGPDLASVIAKAIVDEIERQNPDSVTILKNPIYVDIAEAVDIKMLARAVIKAVRTFDVELNIAAAAADERERCARRVERFFAPCSGVLERRYGRDLAGHIREGT